MPRSSPGLPERPAPPPVSVRSPPPAPLDDTSNDAIIAALIAEMPRTPSPRSRFRPPDRTSERSRPDRGQRPAATRSPRDNQNESSSDAAIAASLAEETPPRTPSPLTPRFLPPQRTPERTPAPMSDNVSVSVRISAEDQAAIAAALDEEWGARRYDDFFSAADAERHSGPMLMVSQRPSTRRPRSPRERPPAPPRERPPAPRGGGDAQASRPAAPGEDTCVACLESAADALLVPCSHINLCVPCAGKLDPPRCPVCRLRVQQVVRTKRKPTQAAPAPAAA